MNTITTHVDASGCTWHTWHVKGSPKPKVDADVWWTAFTLWREEWRRAGRPYGMEAKVLLSVETHH
jgi:hypothetical protein